MELERPRTSSRAVPRSSAIQLCPEDIDKTLKLGTNVPMGPLTLAAPWTGKSSSWWLIFNRKKKKTESPGLYWPGHLLEHHEGFRAAVNVWQMGS